MTAAAVTERAAALAGSPVTEAHRSGGGSAQEYGAASHRLALADGRTVFAKSAAGAPGDFFAAEAAGLTLLAGTGAVAVPRVLGAEPGLILLEWIEPGPATPAQAERLGRDLAELHGTPADGYGNLFDGPSAYIGPLPLPSPPHRPASPADWPGFHAEYRLLPFLRRATDNGGITPADARAVEQLCARIDEVSGPPQPPAVIHGDLWSGNVQWTAAGGRPYLIDPAAQGGHPEIDLAFLELFGCPELPRLLAAYEEIRPVPGRRARVPLHQLHHLLVHAALFGGSYGAQCGAAARAALR